MNRLRRMRLFEICVIALFLILLVSSIIFAAVLHLTQISVTLLLVDFVLALITAVFGSLNIREEEEEVS